MKISSYISAFKWLNGLAAGAGLIIPAYSYFSSLDPPLLPAAGMITLALGAATILFGYYYEPKEKPSKGKLPPLVRLSRLLLGTAIVAFVIYLVLLPWTTVLEPQKNKIRFQTGFGRAEFSLTAKGKELKAKLSDQPIEHWMLAVGAFRQGGPEIIWETWSIYLAGASLVALFITLFCTWTFSWSLLAKQRALDKENEQSKKTPTAPPQPQVQNPPT